MGHQLRFDKPLRPKYRGHQDDENRCQRKASAKNEKRPADFWDFAAFLEKAEIEFGQRTRQVTDIGKDAKNDGSNDRINPLLGMLQSVDHKHNHSGEAHDDVIKKSHSFPSWDDRMRVHCFRLVVSSDGRLERVVCQNVLRIQETSQRFLRSGLLRIFDDVQFVACCSYGDEISGHRSCRPSCPR